MFDPRSTEQNGVFVVVIVVVAVVVFVVVAVVVFVVVAVLVEYAVEDSSAENLWSLRTRSLIKK